MHAEHVSRFLGELFYPVDTFVSTIEKCGLPIKPENAAAFAEALLQFKAPKQILPVIASALDFYSETAFARDLEQLSKLLLEAIGNNPYNFVGLAQDGSGLWLYQRILELTGHEATNIYLNHFHKQGNIYKSLGPESRTTDPRVPFVIVDDFTISGSQIGQLLSPSYFPDNATVYAFVLRSTRAAAVHLQNFCRFHTVGQTITTLKEQFSPHHYYYLINLINTLSGDNQYTGVWNPSLMWSFYKVPDNVPGIFSGHYTSLPILIDPKQFSPPYRAISPPAFWRLKE